MSLEPNFIYEQYNTKFGSRSRGGWERLGLPRGHIRRRTLEGQVYGKIIPHVGYCRHEYARGGYLKDCRRAAKLTQREVAGKLQMTDRAVSDWERGVSLPTFDVMVRLLGIINGDIAEAARLLLASTKNVKKMAATMQVDALLLSALAGHPVHDPDGRYAELARQIRQTPRLAERLPELLSLSSEEFQELIEYLELRRRQRSRQ